jgi:hypothetical protein
VKLVLIIISLLVSFQSFACSCVGSSTVAESAKWADHVFVAEIRSKRLVEEKEWVQTYFDLEVVETLKGTPTNDYFIKPNPLMMLTNCYPQSAAVGNLYVFFVKGNKEVTINHCSSTERFEYLERSQPKWRDSIK